MGLTSWSGTRPRKTDVAVAKNYLDQQELDILNRVVSNCPSTVVVQSTLKESR